MKSLRGMLFTATTFLMIGLSQPANAYVFGFSDFDSNNALILNGSTIVANSYSGWYSGGSHEWSNTNYIVARAGDVGNDPYRNFFVFDIRELTEPVESAVLRLRTYDVTTNETYTLFDVSTDADSLISGDAGIDGFNDLASGNVYGSHAYSPSDSGGVQTISLNSSFLSDLNTAIRTRNFQFVIGGAVDTATVPEPGSLALLGLGMAGLWRTRRRLAR